MNTASIIILIVFALLNLTGIGLYIATHMHEEPKKFWANIAWMLICGVVYIPKGIIDLVKQKKNN